VTEKKLQELEFLANKVLDGHHVRTGYDLAPIILELIEEVRLLKEDLKYISEKLTIYEEQEDLSRYR
jgi:hypothetical protein